MSWLLAFAGFAALIILHEFGHFLVAKWTGMRVERFFLFFPPKLWSIRRGETEYGVGAIPLGGFVKITGMNPDDLEPRPPEAAEGEDGETPNDLLTRIESSGQADQDERLPDGRLRPEIAARAYYSQPVWKRIVVIAAGPAMNILIAFVIFFALAFGAERITGPGLEVGELTTKSPATGLLEPGDRIVSIDGAGFADLEANERAEGFREQIGTHTCAGEPSEGCPASTPVDVVVERDGRELPVSVTPRYDPGAEQALMGVRFEPADVTPVDTFPQAIDFSVDTMWFITSRTMTVLARIFDAEQRKEISGVVGSYEATRQSFELDTRTAVFVLGLISLSLAIINLFPFLPLDGGHIFWSLVEKVRGRRPSFATMERASAIGFVLILFLFFIGLTNDIGRLTGEGFDVR